MAAMARVGKPAGMILELSLAAAAAWAAAQAPQGREELERIEAAIPESAPAPPRKPRRLLVFDLNVGYPGHASCRTANLAFESMGRRTGAFETTVSRDPSVFEPGSLAKFDAVFLNNTVGNLFTDPALRRSLAEFVYGGGGLMGVHGTSVAFTRWTEGGKEDWPEFGIILGARGANHRAPDERVFIKLDDPEHPLNEAFGGRGFEYRSEFFRFHEPYSRRRVRVLLSIDTARTDMNQGPAYGRIKREDDDYALAWVLSYGRGRVFYCTIGHAPSVFWDPTMLKFYLAAAQFVLGDLPAPATPSARLTRAARAQERLGWRLCLHDRGETLFDAVEAASRLGIQHVIARISRPVSREIPAKLGPGLAPEALERIRLKLDSAGVGLPAAEIPEIPADPDARRRLFESGRKAGVEIFLSEPPRDGLDAAEKLCDESGIRLALRGPDPDKLAELCRGRGPAIGACADVVEWLRSGKDPVKAMETLGGRLAAVRLSDIAGAERLMREVRRLQKGPVIFGMDLRGGAPAGISEAERDVELFNRICADLSP